jgi:hypothetical protein
MLFTNPRATVKNAPHPVEQKPLLLFTSNRRSVFRRPVEPPKQVTVVHAQTYESQVAAVQGSKKIKWGEPFWNLFHVLAEKIREEEFHHVRQGLLNLIYSICSNLPCPDCTNHAVHYLNGVNFNAIQTKAQLRDMLYNFHNAVNIRKGYPLYPKDQVESKYSKGNLHVIIQQFWQHFLAKTYNFRLISDDLARKRLSNSIQKWFDHNIHYFHT